MPQELNWAGQPIRDGEGYGGRPENIPKTWGTAGKGRPKIGDRHTLPPNDRKPAKTTAKQHYCVIREGDLCKLFGNGAYTLTRAEAAKLLKELTGTPDKLLSLLKAERPFWATSSHRRENA